MDREETDDENEGRETAYGAIFATAVFRLRRIVCARRANGGLLYPPPPPPPARGGGILFDASWHSTVSSVSSTPRPRTPRRPPNLSMDRAASISPSHPEL